MVEFLHNRLERVVEAEVTMEVEEVQAVEEEEEVAAGRIRILPITQFIHNVTIVVTEHYLYHGMPSCATVLTG